MSGPGPNRPASPPTIHDELLADPIGFLRTELYRQRVACNTLETLAGSTANGDVMADAERVSRYIVEDLPYHIGDLEECLFPLLRRSAPDDSVENAIAHYRGARKSPDRPVGRLVSILDEVACGTPPPPDFQAIAQTVVERWRNDLSAEADEILPLAEQRMTEADLASLGEAMVHRRGQPGSL